MIALLDIENKTREIASHPIFILNLHVAIPFHIDYNFTADYRKPTVVCSSAASRPLG